MENKKEDSLKVDLCKICFPSAESSHYDSDDEKETNINHSPQSHKSILSIRDVDKNKIKKQTNPDDLYFEKREEFKRQNVLKKELKKVIRKNKGMKEPWLDVRCYDETKDYERYCDYCKVFARNDHEKSPDHWRIIFMDDVKRCLFKSK